MTRGRSSFGRYIGIDYSGARTPLASLKGLRAYIAGEDSQPAEVLPAPGPRKYWSRRGLAEWLVEQLASGPPAIVGIDHGFSFPLKYFEVYGLARDWPAFLEDFHRHWPTDGDTVRVEDVRMARVGEGAARAGERSWLRQCESRAGAAKSVFFFDVHGSVAKSTHAGLPWLLSLRKQLGARAHFWPFDGWDAPAGASVIAEVYPSLWSRAYARADRSPDQHDAWSVARWLRDADRDGRLPSFLDPLLTDEERERAAIEGWILGVGARPTP